MKRSHLPLIPFSIALSVGFAFGCSSQTAPTSQGGPAPDPPAAPQAPLPDGQARIAEATFRLEKTFSEQFVRGQIDRMALAGPVHDVLQAVPDAARARVQDRIDRIVGAGEKLASELPAKARAELAAPPPNDKIGRLEQGVVAAWGWPGFAGWGGVGAFGFPGMYYGYGGTSGYSSNSGYSTGYSTGSSTGYSNVSGFNSASYSGCGLGYGCYGWYW